MESESRVMSGVTEYSEGRSVLLEEVVSNGERRPVVVGLVDGTGAEIDLLVLVGWLKNNQPDLLA